MSEEVSRNRVERKFWSPSVTSQFCVCPIPFHFDTYRGCTYGCLFCFARDLTEFARRNKDENHKRQSYLEGNDPKGLLKWIEKTMASAYDYSKAEVVAFKERIPVKIGATADPFPIIEKWEHITYDCLKIFDKLDYPVQISTKNPEVFLSSAKDFVGSNIALNVSCSFCDDDIARQIECGAISPSRRFAAIKELSKLGFKITVRIQPFILPYSEKVADRFIKTLSECGAWDFETEGLKMRVTSSLKERLIYKKMSEALGYNVLAYFKKRGIIEGGDRVYSAEDKRSMLSTYTYLAKKYGLKFFNADNLIDSRYGCGCECCGTEFLRNHKIWGGSKRALAFKDSGAISSEEFGKCLVNFTRNTNKHNLTIAQVSRMYKVNRK